MSAQVDKISKSQAECLETCPRMFAYRYIENIKEPSKEKPLLIGSAFHSLVQGDNATFDHLTMELERDAYPHGPVIKKMKESFDEATNGLPEAKTHEVEFVHESSAGVSVNGFVDSVRVARDGSWYVTEIKTASSIDPNKQIMLPFDLQIATYVTARKEVAQRCDLDSELFQGVIYTTTTKPRERQKKNESLDSFVARCSVQTSVWTLDLAALSNAEAIVHARYSYAKEMRDYVRETYKRSGSAELIPRNQRACFNYSRPCQYFKRCYGVDPCLSSDKEPSTD